MAKGLVTDTYLTAIADAIRVKNGTSTQYKPSEMSNAIINLPSSSTIKVAPTSISFRNYTGTSLDLSCIDASNLTSMYEMFSDCTNLINLNFIGFNTSNVTRMDSAFYRCSSIVTLDLSSFDTSSVTTMKSMFYGCTALETLDISNFTFNEGVTLDGMFTNCGVNTGKNTIVYVKDETAQQKVLASQGVPSNWSTSNIIIKEVS